MKATTIKLEGELLIELEKMKGSGKSLTSFVKKTLEAEIRRQKMRRAAETYTDFLKDHPEELNLMEEWERAPLCDEIKCEET